jgi:hypothetical protein
LGFLENEDSVFATQPEGVLIVQKVTATRCFHADLFYKEDRGKRSAQRNTRAEMIPIFSISLPLCSLCKKS